MAQYRVDEYDAALSSLTRSRNLNEEASNGEPFPRDIVFLAMSHHRLDEPAEAKSLLAKLRELVASDRWKDDAQLQRFLREAETLIEPPPDASASV